MAIRKIKTHKGIECDYWRIDDSKYNYRIDVATVSLWLYYNQEASKNLANSLIKEVIQVSGIRDMLTPERLDLNPADLMKTLLYQKIKESNIEKSIEIVDGKEVIKDTELNWFVDAVDC